MRKAHRAPRRRRCWRLGSRKPGSVTNASGTKGEEPPRLLRTDALLAAAALAACAGLVLPSSPAVRACFVASQACVALGLRRALAPKLHAATSSLKRRIRSAPRTLRTRWREAALQPVVAALVGWVTNWIAVQAIFYPIEYVGFPLKRFVLGSVCGCDVVSPLGLVGWQGIVPAKAPRMASTMVDLVTSRLLSVEEVFERVDPRRVSELFMQEANAMAQEIGSDSAPAGLIALGASRMKHLPATMLARLQGFRDEYVAGLVRSLKGRMEEALDLKHLVVTELTSDKKGCVEVFRTTGKRELSFLTDSGLWFGFLLGLLQMLVWSVFDNGFTTTIGGLLVGYATNWLALKCIFSPVDPVYFCGIKFQGLFLQRQNEVADDFSDFLTARVLTSEKIWNHLLNGPGEDGFRKLVREYTAAFASSAAEMRDAVGPRVEQSLSSLSDWVGEEVVDKLPAHVNALHSYIDSVLSLRELLRDRLRQMDPADFERVLHPIFEEDEFTLILAGGALGGAAGYLQYLVGKRLRLTANRLTMPLLAAALSDKLQSQKPELEPVHLTVVSNADGSRRDQVGELRDENETPVVDQGGDDVVEPSYMKADAENERARSSSQPWNQPDE